MRPTVSTRRSLGAALGALAALGLSGRPGQAAAPSPYPHPVLLEVTSILVAVELNIDSELRSLVDRGDMRDAVAAFVRSRLQARRLEVAVVVDRGPGLTFVVPDDLDRGTLVIVLTLTLRRSPVGADGLPCCLGALSIRLERRNSRWSEGENTLVVARGEPFFASDDHEAINEHVLTAAGSLLGPTLDSLPFM